MNYVFEHCVEDRTYHIEYTVQGLPSCCGIALIHGFESVSLGYASLDTQLVVLKAFSKFLTRPLEDLDKRVYDVQPHNDPPILKRSKLIIADAVHGEYGSSTPSLYKMCINNKVWKPIGDSVKNTNSDNHICMFEFNKHT